MTRPDPIAKIAKLLDLPEHHLDTKRTPAPKPPALKLIKGGKVDKGGKKE